MRLRLRGCGMPCRLRATRPNKKIVGRKRTSGGTEVGVLPLAFALKNRSFRFKCFFWTVVYVMLNTKES